MRAPLVAFFASLVWAIAPALAQPLNDAAARAIRGESRPRLVVVISIDQFRADYLTRLSDLFLPATQTDASPGGFNHLTTRGAWFVNARYEHVPLYTGPGHAVILTGSHPYKSGIVGNDWWDRATGKFVYCVDDATATVVGAAPDSKAKPMSAANLRVSTVGDELKLATGGKAKVVTLALKDRAAILLGGHSQDLSIWYDTTGGRWISSSAYCRDGSLPAWVTAINDEHIPDQSLGTQWTPSLAPDLLAARSIPMPFVGTDLPEGFGVGFPHPVGAEKTKANYRAFTFTPAANAFTFQTAIRAVLAERLGQDDIPDLLAINLSTNDYVGHVWGPYSPEALDLTVQTDHQLAEFLKELGNAVPGGLDRVMVVLTADHGVSPVPEQAGKPPFSLPTGRFDVEAILRTVDQSLTARFGAPASGSWLAIDSKAEGVEAAYLDGYLYLNPQAVKRTLASGKPASMRDIEQVASDAINLAGIKGVHACYGRTQILEGRVADTDMGRHLAKGVHAQLSSDLIVVPDPMWLTTPLDGGHATTHGTPYTYDTHVPVILCAPGIIRPGVYADAVAPSDIAPTLSLILGVEFPSGCDGQPLLPALR